MAEKMDLALKKVVTPEFRVSFPHLDKPQAFRGNNPKYSVSCLFEKKVDLTKVKKAAYNAVTEVFGSDKSKWPKNLRLPFRDGGEKTYDGYEPGMTWFTASKNSDKGAPKVFDRNRDEIVDVKNEVYAGCWARATLIAYCYDKRKEFGTCGVGFSLLAIQKTKDGEEFGNNKNAAADFDDGYVIEEDGSEDPTNYSSDNSDDEFADLAGL